MSLDIDSVPQELKLQKRRDEFGAATVTRAACGLYHSLVVGKKGRVPQLFAWGRNHSNVLGLGIEVKEEVFPKQVPHFAKSHVFQVACGLSHSVVLIKVATAPSGRLYSFGLGLKGRLGYTKSTKQRGGGDESPLSSQETQQQDGGEEEAWFTPKPTRIKFPQKAKIVRVSAGADHTLAISDLGLLFAWGSGQHGNLGNGDISDEYFPIQIDFPGIKEPFVTHCAAGGKHSLACLKDGSCYSWGHNGNGRLGHGHTRALTIPTLIEYLIGKQIVFVAAGEAHSAAIDRAGVLYTWGAGSFGRLGHGDDSDMPVPRKIEEFGGVPIMHVSCGTFHTLAVSTAGVPFAWGAGTALGLLAEGDTTIISVPRQIRDGGMGTSVCQMAAGTYHSIAITLTGDVLCWGVGGQSRLGHGDSLNQAIPKYIAELRGRAFTADLRGLISGYSATTASPRGDGLTGSEGWRISQVSCGDSHTLFLTRSGVLWVTGSNKHGQLGLGESEDVWEPVQVTSFRDPIKRVAAGGTHCLAINARGDLFSWGGGASGQLGLGKIMDVFTPQPVASIGNVFDVVAGEDYSACLVAAEVGGTTATEGVYAEAGSAWTWGSCEAGKLGHENMSSGVCLAPKRIRLSTPISKLACGSSHMLGVNPSGHVFSWGAGYYGRLGVASSANSSVPVRVLFPEDVRMVDVAAGAYHSMALSATGNLWIWGRDSSVCGADHLTRPEIFSEIEGSQGVPACHAIAACGEHSFAVTQSGQVFGWGNNKNFQLGLGKKGASFSKRPELLHVLPDKAETIATGNAHSVVVLRGGEALAFGSTGSGRLGIGHQKPFSQPIPAPVIANWFSIEEATGISASPSSQPVGTPRLFGRAEELLLASGQEGIPTDTEANGNLRAHERRIVGYLERLKSPNDTICDFGVIQQLLKDEPRETRFEELALLEDDLIKIFGGFLNIILKMDEAEVKLKVLESQVEDAMANVISAAGCTPPLMLSHQTRSPVVEFYLSKLEPIQRLVQCLYIQPAYLVSLAIALKHDVERQVLLSAVKELYWSVDDRQVNALFLGMCSAVCAAEVQLAPDLLQLFSPGRSNFIQLFALYASQLSNLSTLGHQLLDPNEPGSAAAAIESLQNTMLALDIVSFQSLSTQQLSSRDAQSAFHRSLEGLRAVLSLLDKRHLRLPLGVCALLKVAYENIIARDFLFDSTGASQSNPNAIMYPFVRLLLQGLIAKLWKDPMKYHKTLFYKDFTSSQAEVNFRTLWTFLNSAFENDFAPFDTAHLLREIFQGLYARTSELVTEVVFETQTNYIRTELTLGLFLTHFDSSSHTVTVRSDTIAALLNLLKSHEAHLHLSVYDPVAEIIKEIAGSRSPVFDKAQLAALSPAVTHNVTIDRRFLLKERNAVFDSVTTAPVPQRLALRQQAATHEGRAVISLVQRLTAPDPADPRFLIQSALLSAPAVRSTTVWADMQDQFERLQEFYTRQDPPQYTVASMMAKAAEVASTLEGQEVSPISYLKWMAESAHSRLRHRIYLATLLKGEDDVADAERRYQFDQKKRREQLGLILSSIKKLDFEEELRRKMEQERLRPFIDELANRLNRRRKGNDDKRNESRTVHVSFTTLAHQGVLLSLDESKMSADQRSNGRIMMTVNQTSSSLQILCPKGLGEEDSLDQFVLDISEMNRLRSLPSASIVTYGKGLVTFQVGPLLNFALRVRSGGSVRT